LRDTDIILRKIYIVGGHMANETPLESSLKAGINAGIAEFRSAPYRFLYESDIQACLYSHLRHHVPETINVPRVGGVEPYILALINSEYSTYKIDLVCIDPENVARKQFTRDHTFRGNDIYIYQLPLLLGLELKYAWMGYNEGFGKWESDMAKLKGIKEDLTHRLVLGFFQSDELADGFYQQIGHQMKRKMEDYQELPRLDGIFLVSQRVVKEVLDSAAT
jgi:hypothetical protein